MTHEDWTEDIKLSVSASVDQFHLANVQKIEQDKTRSRRCDIISSINQHRPFKKTVANTGKLRDWVHVCANIHVRQGTVLDSFAKRNIVVTVMDSHIIVTPSCSSPTDWYLSPV